MYKAHFGLRERPFSIAPDPRYLYLGRRHRDALAHLLYGVRERGGFVQLTGDVGTGKTTLTRALLEQLPESVDVALILNPAVTVQELLLAVCEELRVPLPPGTGSVSRLMTALRDHLLEAFARGRHTVILIDEAQNLGAEALEQVRMLTNLETNREKLLQIILVGQPELRSLLARHDLRQVAQRVTARCHLPPLSRAETRDYIRHRLRTAGGSTELFSAAAVRTIHRRAHGIPRLINIISDRALLGAYAIGRRRVTLGIALRAAAEVEGRERRWPQWLALAGTAAGLAVAALFAVPSLSPPWPQQAPPAVAAGLPGTPASLADRLRQHDAGLDPRVALRLLFGRWGGEYRADDERTACEQAHQQGLRCEVEALSWAALISRNLPTVLELKGVRHAVLLSGLEGTDAILDLDGTAVRVPQSELVEAWSGSAFALWRPPAAVSGAILPGSRGPEVAWLRRQLDRIEGRSGTPPAHAVYDADLQRRVRAFQRAQGLAVDGIVGVHTLLHLMLAAPEPDMPRLTGS